MTHGTDICLLTLHAVQAMESEVDYIRQLEARVRSLEAENKALRAVLDNRSTLSGNSSDEASAEKTPQSDSPSGPMDKHNSQIETASSTLNPEAKIELFRTRFAGRADLYARRWESRDGKKRAILPCVRTSGVMAFAKSR